jgi:hypothetical protein
MRRHTKPNNEKVLKNDSFVRSRLRDGLNAEMSAMSLGKVVGIALHQPKPGLCDIRLTKVIADSSHSSRRCNLEAPGVVKSSFTILRIARLALAVGLTTKWCSNLRGGPLCWLSKDTSVYSTKSS